jgi:DNA-binding LacI/PurR family transcriptional regulator
MDPVFKALADPTRRTLLDRLFERDGQTLGALEAIQGMGLRIPADVALVGYDDMPWALAITPPLTVVRQSGYELGARAMELLLQRVREPARSTAKIVLDPELVVRRSCGS